MKINCEKADPGSPVPLPEQIKKQILSMIDSGRLLPRQRILSETKLAAEFGVSRLTARQAVMELISEGFLVRAHGRGTFVSETPGAAPRGRELPVIAIVPNLRTSFYHAVIAGLEKELSNNDIGLLLKSANEDPHEEKNCVEKALLLGVRGLAFFAESYSHKNLALLMEANGKLPFVTVDVAVEGLECDLVVSDDREGGAVITRHLAELGHRRILHLAGPPGDSSAMERAAGYRDALGEYGIEPEEQFIRYTNWHFEEGYFEAKKFFYSSSGRATAVFACNDEVGAGAYRALVELGIKVPGEIALAGYGNLSCGKFIEVPLTTVDQSAASMGRFAAELLLRKIKSERRCQPPENNEAQTIKVPVKLVIRDSCGIKLPGGRGQPAPDCKTSKKEEDKHEALKR